MSSTREQILKATSDLIEKQGYHATGLNEIIRVSGAPKGSLYYYFPDGKEQITAEAVLQAGVLTAGRIKTGLGGSAGVARVIRDFVLIIAGHVESSGFAAGSPLTAVAVETATQSERINTACREAYSLIESAFKGKLLESGFAEVQAGELATLITASIEGGVILSRTYHTGHPLRTVARQLEAFLSQLIQKEIK